MTTAPGGTTVRPAATAAAALTATYRRLAAACDALNVRIARADTAAVEATPPGVHLGGAELARSPEALDALIEAEATRLRERHGHDPRADVAAALALHGYLWSVSLLMSGPWYLERRVPRVQREEVRLDLATGAYHIVPGTGFACLPGDRAADLPGVRVVADEEALRAELRTAVADHIRPLLTAIGPRMRRGPRALWGTATDDLVSGIWYLGRMLGQEDRAVRAATELLPGGIPPFPGGAGFRRLAGRHGDRYPTRTRISCCTYYTLDSAQECLTCPRTCDAERLRRLENGS